MFDNPWAVIPVFSIIAWLLVAGTALLVSRTRKADAGRLQTALDANTTANRQVADRLEAFDRRLAAVEKTLTDIG